MFIPDPGSEFFPSRILDPNFFHPGPWIRIKDLSTVRILTEKFFLASQNMIRVFIPDPYPDFLPIQDPGSRGQTGPGSRIRIRNTDYIRSTGFLICIDERGMAQCGFHSEMSLY